MSIICTKCSTDFIPAPNKPRAILLSVLGGMFVLFGIIGLCAVEPAGFIPLLIGVPLFWWAWQCFSPKTSACPACGSLSVIPVSTPAGQKLMSEAKPSVAK